MKFDQLYRSILESVSTTTRTIAIVPGSFKPPHAGHWDMIQQYAKIADQVIVLISQPSSKSARYTKSGKTISAEMSAMIFEIYKKAYGLRNVDIEVSASPSPVSATFDKISNLSNNENVILGASTKDNDWQRWKSAVAWTIKNEIPVTILDIEKNAVKPLSISGTEISASTIRDNIDDIELIKTMLPKKLKESDIKRIVEILS